MTDEEAAAPAEPAPQELIPETPAAPAPVVEPARGELVEPVIVEQTPVEPVSPTPPSVHSPTPVIPTAPSNIVQELLVRARARIQEKKRKKFEKIMEKLNQDGKVTNNEVEKLLRVSDSTATRYLLYLAKECRIKRIGSRGRAVFYSKI